ncbi:MAG: gliding motility-associated C-terminal domain-containing protein [Bacteroidia bacterium]
MKTKAFFEMLFLIRVVFQIFFFLLLSVPINAQDIGIPPDTFLFEGLAGGAPKLYSTSPANGITDFAVEGKRLFVVAICDSSQIRIGDKNFALNHQSKDSLYFTIISSTIQDHAINNDWIISGSGEYFKKAGISVLNGYIYCAVVFQHYLFFEGQEYATPDYATAFFKIKFNGQVDNFKIIPGLIFHDFQMTLEGPLFTGGFRDSLLLQDSKYLPVGDKPSLFNNFIVSFDFGMKLRWLKIMSHNYLDSDQAFYDQAHSIRFIHKEVNGKIFFVNDYTHNGIWINAETLLKDTLDHHTSRYLLGSLNLSTGAFNWYHALTTNFQEFSCHWDYQRQQMFCILSNDSALNSEMGLGNISNTYPLLIDGKPVPALKSYNIYRFSSAGSVRIEPISALRERLKFFTRLENGHYITFYGYNPGNLNTSLEKELTAAGANPKGYNLLELDEDFHLVNIISKSFGWFSLEDPSRDEDLLFESETMISIHQKSGIKATGFLKPEAILIAPKKINVSDYTLYIPNAFSPNGDFINDQFYWYSSGLFNSEIKIFSRTGEKVYEGEGPWDGTYKGERLNGTFDYIFRAQGFYDQTIEKSGSIQIIP